MASPAIEQLQWLGLLAFSGVLGAMIGIEREFAHKPAGLRTHMFIAMASTLFTLLGYLVIGAFGHGTPVRSDPVRIMQAIVVGVSFLGAGTIIHAAADRVEGLTTAASILLVAAVGMAVGVGAYVLAVGATLLAVMVLVMLRPMDRWMSRRNGK